jgi:hypothetical protein
MLTLLLTTLLAAAPGDGFIRFPPGATTQGLLELTKSGELWFLPVQDRVPFRAALATRSAGRCADMEAAMMDVEGYQKRWPMKEVVILERTPERIRYELTLDLVMAPKIPGVVERIGPGKIRFSDPDTGSSSQWTMRDTGAGCLLNFVIADKAGAESSYVSVARAVEAGSSDTINMSGAIASVRGYTKAETVPGGPAIGEAGTSTWNALADEGTVIRFDRDPKRFARVHVARRVTTPPDRVLWAIRDRAHYAEKTDVIDKASERGGEADYRFGFFGGRVSIKTRVVEEGTIDAPTGVRIVENVTSGDVDQGTWTWTVQAVEGGTHVGLYFDMNIIPGSSILTALAREDPGFKEGMALRRDAARRPRRRRQEHRSPQAPAGTAADAGRRRGRRGALIARTATDTSTRGRRRPATIEA